MITTPNLMPTSLNLIALYVAWFQSIVATLGSLYYSEIKHYTPCTLCWYQRILMYPLVVIFAVAILRKEYHIKYYALPLSLIGSIVAFYHVLLQKGFLPESVAPCSIGASCTIKYAGYFGFITIPVMSVTAFVIISTALFLIRLPHNK